MNRLKLTSPGGPRAGTMRPGFGRTVLLALALAVSAAALSALGRPLLSVDVLLAALMPLLAALYLCLVCRAARMRSGRLALAAAWLLMALALPFGDASLGLQLTAHSVALALFRIWAFALRPLTVIAELLIALLAAAAAVAALSHTGSVAIATWCFFLAHASGELLPRQVGARVEAAGNDRFESAHRQAEAALRRLGRTG